MITPRFLDWLEVRHLDAIRRQLLAEFRFDSAEFGARIILPVGFITDFGSAPRRPLVYLVAGGIGDGPGAIHDFLYTIRQAPRALCDRVFYEALLTDGRHVGQPAIEGWRARAMLAGVRLGGGSHWRD